MIAFTVSRRSMSRDIIENNLGRKKLNTKKKHHECLLRDIAHKAANSIFDKAECVAVEDLTLPIKSKNNFSKSRQRRLSSWVKGLLAEALDNVSARRSASVVLVNAAYTSQTCSTCGALGTRTGELIERFSRAVETVPPGLELQPT